MRKRVERRKRLQVDFGKSLPDTVAEDVSENTAQLAIQGPNAIKVIRKIFKEEDIPEKNYSFTLVDGLLNSAVMLSRTGYTAEDGFEIYCACNDAVRLLTSYTKRVRNSIWRFAGSEHAIRCA